MWPCDSVTNWPVITASHGNKYIVEESSLTEWACNIISDPAINAGVDTVTTVGPRLTNASTGHAAESYAVTRLLKDQGRPAALVAMVVTKEPNRLSDVQYSLLDMVSQAYLAEIDRTVLADKLAQANLKLNQLQVHKDWFVAAAAHHLRTPLTSIKGFAQLMARDPSSMSISGNRKSGTILSESDRLVDIVDDLIGLEAGEKHNIAIAR